MKKERILYFDYCKGILIILVVLGHTMPENTIRHVWLYSWHIPAFFVIDGILLSYSQFSKRSLLGWEGIIWNGIHKLIIPYFWYGGMLLIARWINNGFSFENLRWQLIDLGTFCGIGATWFLPCIFLVQLIYFFIVKMTEGTERRSIYKIIVIIVIFTIPLVAPNTNFVTFVVYRACYATFFCVIGDLIQPLLWKYRSVKTTAKIIATVAVSLTSICFFAFSGFNDASLNVLRIGNPFFYIVNALLGTIAMMMIVYSAEAFLENRFFLALTFFGKNSLIIMGTHQIIMLIIRCPISDRFLINLLLCLLILFIEIPVIILINKIKTENMKG